MKKRSNRRLVAFFVAISMMVGVLSGNGYAGAIKADEKKSESVSLPEGYSEGTHKVEGDKHEWVVNAKDIILVADKTNYIYMRFNTDDLDNIVENLKDMYQFVGNLRNGESYTRYFQDNNGTEISYTPGKESKEGGRLTYKNKSINERGLDVKYEDGSDNSLIVKLYEHENQIKTMKISNNNECEILDANGNTKYILKAETGVTGKDYTYRILYKSATSNDEINLDKLNGNKGYRLSATENMKKYYGLLLGYKVTGSSAAPTTPPAKQPNTTTSPSSTGGIKSSVTIAMGETLKYEKLLDGKADVKISKKDVIIKKKDRDILSKSKKGITAKYTKKKISKKINITVNVGKVRKKVSVKVVVIKPNKIKKNVKIKTNIIKVNGKQYNKIMFFYNFNKNTKIQVKLKGKNKQFNSILKKYVNGNKGYRDKNKNVYITTSSRNKNVTFKVRLCCGKNKSEWIRKKLKLK